MTDSNALNRRHFVQTASSAAIITAATKLRAQQKADSNETLRIGLVGCASAPGISVPNCEKACWSDSSRTA